MTIKQVLISGTVMAVAFGVMVHQMPHLRTTAAAKLTNPKTKLALRRAQNNQVASAKKWASSFEKIFFGNS